MNLTAEGLRLPCSNCGRGTDECVFCQDPDCHRVICHSCLIVELGEAMREPHDHGG